MRTMVKEEFDKFMEIRRGLDDQLCTLLLTDIIASLVNVCKNEQGEVIKDYTEFDKVVSNIKEMLNSVDVPNINLVDSVKQSVRHIEKMQTECDYSLRTLDWILGCVIPEMEKEEEDNA